jgi:hypothetical protein
MEFSTLLASKEISDPKKNLQKIPQNYGVKLTEGQPQKQNKFKTPSEMNHTDQGWVHLEPHFECFSWKCYPFLCFSFCYSSESINIQSVMILEERDGCD